MYICNYDSHNIHVEICMAYFLDMHFLIKNCYKIREMILVKTRKLHRMCLMLHNEAFSENVLLRCNFTFLHDMHAYIKIRV